MIPRMEKCCLMGWTSATWTPSGITNRLQSFHKNLCCSLGQSEKILHTDLMKELLMSQCLMKLANRQMLLISSTIETFSQMATIQLLENVEWNCQEGKSRESPSHVPLFASQRSSSLTKLRAVNFIFARIILFSPWCWKWAPSLASSGLVDQRWTADNHRDRTQA